MCGNGRYQPKAGQQTCRQCPRGYIAPPVGADASRERAGEDGGRTACKACEQGKHSYADNTECLGRFELIQRQATEGMGAVATAIGGRGKSAASGAGADGIGDGDSAGLPKHGTVDE
jgi:hypothetical protein